MLEPAEGEGVEDGGGRTPTRNATELRPLACTASLLPATTVGSSALRAALRRRRRGGPGGALIPGRRAFAGVPAGEHLCTAILDSLPQSLPPRGSGGKGEGTRGAWVQPQPLRGHGAELARGESQKDARENYNAQRLATLTSAGLGALLPRHTPPRSDTQKAAPAAATSRNPHGPGAAGEREGGDPGRAGGRRAATEGAEGREGGGKMEPGPYLSTDCSFSSSFFCLSMTARMIFLSSSVRWLRSGISGCRGG